MEGGNSRGEILEKWLVRSGREAVWHFEAARHAEFLDRLLTGVNVIASLLVLGFSFDFAAGDGRMFKIFGNHPGIPAALLGAASVVILFLAIMQYIVDYRSKAHAYVHAAKEFSAIRRRVEVAIADPAEGHTLQEIEQAWAAANRIAPLLPGRIWRKYRFRYGAEDGKPKA